MHVLLIAVPGFLLFIGFIFPSVRFEPGTAGYEGANATAVLCRPPPPYRLLFPWKRDPSHRPIQNWVSRSAFFKGWPEAASIFKRPFFSEKLKCTQNGSTEKKIGIPIFLNENFRTDKNKGLAFFFLAVFKFLSNLRSLNPKMAWPDFTKWNRLQLIRGLFWIVRSFLHQKPCTQLVFIPEFKRLTCSFRKDYNK